jgi:hypothetical protein
MDKYAGARHSAYTLRRFYPAIYGRNMTSMPSQYGASQREKSTAELAAETGATLLGRYGTRLLEGRFTDAEIARENLRQRGEAEAYARRVSADALAQQMSQKPFNPVPWLIGGLGVAAAGGIIYYVMSKRKA